MITMLDGTKYVEQLLTGTCKKSVHEVCRNLYQWHMDTAKTTGVAFKEINSHDLTIMINNLASKYVKSALNTDICVTEFFKVIASHGNENNANLEKIKKIAENHLYQLFKGKKYPGVEAWFENYYSANLDPKHTSSCFILLDQVMREDRNEFLKIAKKVITPIKIEWLTLEVLEQVAKNIASNYFPTAIYTEEDYASFLSTEFKRARMDSAKLTKNKEYKIKYPGAMEKYLLEYLKELIQIEESKKPAVEIKLAGDTPKPLVQKESPSETPNENNLPAVVN